jgi:hypothetical protein
VIFTEQALNLIIRTSEGTLRAVKNLCIGSLIEAVRDRTKTVDLKQVIPVLLQPHWRHNPQYEPQPPHRHIQPQSRHHTVKKSSGETDAGTAGKHPARDSRSQRATEHVAQKTGGVPPPLGARLFTS